MSKGEYRSKHALFHLKQQVVISGQRTNHTNHYKYRIGGELILYDQNISGKHPKLYPGRNNEQKLNLNMKQIKLNFTDLTSEWFVDIKK